MLGRQILVVGRLGVVQGRNREIYRYYAEIDTLKRELDDYASGVSGLLPGFPFYAF